MIMETNKFTGTNYNDWLWNLRNVLDFENWGYVLDKPLLTALSKGSLPEERITFEKWLEDNHKKPYEIWYGKSASYKYLRVWGSPAYFKRLVGDKLDSRSSLCGFVGYPKETAGYYFYDPSEQKELLDETSEAPQQNNGSFEPMVSIDSVPVLCRSVRESRPPDRYGFLGLTSQLDNDPRTYGEAILDIDLDKWLKAMRSEMDSMGSNKFRPS
ncbi:UNVERIFIED_CONTAM: hypothetical protein Scaly_3071700 [Sesamum calycinum]|uniref:Retroviral polymerase SH3-like domain-containing protein n=1 Tax=Sesamum calycinum TaxID=2727403 RepID=A0AAW2JWV4_9LAMI